MRIIVCTLDLGHVIICSSMSLLNYFRKKTPEEQGVFLPKAANRELPSEVLASANAQVGESASEIEPRRKRAKVTQHSYSDETRASIGKYASLRGPAATVRHFSGICGHAVPESTVRKFRDIYRAELKAQSSLTSGPVTVSSLPCKPKGRPLLLGNLDAVVKQYVLQLRAAGGVINADVVVAAARGIVESKDRSKLVEYGGQISIEKSWAKSLLTRMNFVKRKGSTAAKLPPSEFENLKQSYLERIKEAVFSNNIVPQMVINMDQTAISLVPSSSWTMDERGKNKIVIKGIEDK